MDRFVVTYIGICGTERVAVIDDAEDAYEARKIFEQCYWSYHEILSVEPERKGGVE